MVSSVMVTFHSGKPDVVFAGMKRKPESKPFDIGWHGESAVDCVTVWFPCVTVEKSRGVSKNVIYVKYNAWHGNPC